MIKTELPFPQCVGEPAVTHRRHGGLAAVSGIQRVTGDEQLIDDLLDEPSIANLYSSYVATDVIAAQMPYDGYLGDFLIRNEGFVRDSPAICAVIDDLVPVRER